MHAVVNKKYYGVIKFSGNTITNDDGDTITLNKRADIGMGPGYVYAPYTPLVTKLVIIDENGTREIWQIGRWKRFKLWFAKITGRLKNIG